MMKPWIFCCYKKVFQKFDWLLLSSRYVVIKLLAIIYNLVCTYQLSVSVTSYLLRSNISTFWFATRWVLIFGTSLYRCWPLFITRVVRMNYHFLLFHIFSGRGSQSEIIITRCLSAKFLSIRFLFLNDTSLWRPCLIFSTVPVNY